jgi:hypothetical protein
VLERDGHLCARCSKSILNVPSSIHHRCPRRMGGTTDPRINDPRNLVRICGTGTTGCHGMVESYRDQARIDGWLLRSLDDLDRPLRTLWGTTVRLFEDGSRVDDWPTEEAPS